MEVNSFAYKQFSTFVSRMEIRRCDHRVSLVCLMLVDSCLYSMYIFNIVVLMCYQSIANVPNLRILNIFKIVDPKIHFFVDLLKF